MYCKTLDVGVLFISRISTNHEVIKGTNMYCMATLIDNLDVDKK